MESKPTSLDKVARYRRLLRKAISAAGLTVIEVERRLGYGPRSLQRVMTGRFDLKLRHVCDVLEEIGMREEDFFAAAAQPGPEGGLLGQLRRIGYRGRMTTLEELDGSPEEFERILDEAMDRTIERRLREGRPVPVISEAELSEVDSPEPAVRPTAESQESREPPDHGVRAPARLGRRGRKPKRI
jgi:hypothetical protein